ncbi:hypothetical protein [Fulvimonas yonginensis]|uniref:WD40 repeat protein n=1 Tax=Fulvimonas yonginensis TaxID=1495200 RepID=A0ABU8J7A4_9GAMM
MRLSICLALPTLVAACGAAATGLAAPRLFAPGLVSGPGDEGAAAPTPDGTSVYFMRGNGDGWTLLEFHRDGARWSAPPPAPFPGRWRDLGPAMAPDGSHLLFVSNRPTHPCGALLGLIRGGQRRTGMGMNLWRVDRKGAGRGRPVRLPDPVDRCSTTPAPSIAGDGSVYFIGCDGNDLRLMHAAYRHGRYLPAHPVTPGDADALVRDPAIAPDRSFIVVSVNHGPGTPYRLAIAFHTPAGWTAPQDLGDGVNRGTHSRGAQLTAGGRTLYFHSDRPAPALAAGDNLWQLSLACRRDAHAGSHALRHCRE